MVVIKTSLDCCGSFPFSHLQCVNFLISVNSFLLIPSSSRQVSLFNLKALHVLWSHGNPPFLIVHGDYVQGRLLVHGQSRGRLGWMTQVGLYDTRGAARQNSSSSDEVIRACLKYNHYYLNQSSWLAFYMIWWTVYPTVFLIHIFTQSFILIIICWNKSFKFYSPASG